MGNFISYSRLAPSLFAPRRRLHFRPFVAFPCPAACISQLHFLAFLPLTRPNFSTRVTAAGISSFVYSLSFVLVFIASDRLEYSQHIKAGKQTPAPTNSNTSKSIEASPCLQYPSYLFLCFSWLFSVDRYDSIRAGRQPQTQTWIDNILSIYPKYGCTQFSRLACTSNYTMQSFQILEFDKCQHLD